VIAQSKSCRALGLEMSALGRLTQERIEMRSPALPGLKRLQNYSLTVPLSVDYVPEHRGIRYMRMLPKLSSVSILVCSALCLMAQGAYSQVGTWKVDTRKSQLGTGPLPKSITMNILKDSPEMASWRVDLVDDKGEKVSYSWSGPEDGSMHPVKDQAGNTLRQESMKKAKDGAILRHGEFGNGGSYDGFAKTSADGNALTDTITFKGQDGKQTGIQKIVALRVSKTAK
jgi:hypothetical protein